MMDETTRLPVRLETGEIVYRDRNQTISLIRVHFEGFTKEYFVSDHGERVGVLVARGNDILLVRQYRLLINGLSYEIPGGRVDKNETPETAAIRECLEETAVECSGLKPLLCYHPSLDIWKNYTRLFYTDKYKEIAKNESGQRVWIPLPRCIKMVFAQQIVDSLSIVAILAYQILMSGPSL